VLRSPQQTERRSSTDSSAKARRSSAISAGRSGGKFSLSSSKKIGFRRVTEHWSLLPGEEEVTRARPYLLPALIIHIFATVITVGMWSPMLLAVWLTARKRVWIITSRRLIALSGVLSQSSTSVGLEKIQDVTYTRKLSDRLFGTGSLVVESAATQGAIAVSFIRDADRFRDELYGAMEKLRTAPAHAGG
jgi:membrane protein YdbS with pleckstrin-like domain